MEGEESAVARPLAGKGKGRDGGRTRRPCEGGRWRRTWFLHGGWWRRESTAARCGHTTTVGQRPLWPRAEGVERRTHSHKEAMADKEGETAA
ncbi:hypothetical protein SESBI_27293 [Sesbania bispinosa]|nr:hypothetical protein SESBI_27293 [Sesbania bispinosa]